MVGFVGSDGQDDITHHCTVLCRNERGGGGREGGGGRGRSYTECSLNRIPTLSAFGNRIVHLHVHTHEYPNTLLAARAGGCMLVTAIYTPPISLVKWCREAAHCGLASWAIQERKSEVTEKACRVVPQGLTQLPKPNSNSNSNYHSPNIILHATATTTAIQLPLSRQLHSQEASSSSLPREEHGAVTTPSMCHCLCTRDGKEERYTWHSNGN